MAGSNAHSDDLLYGPGMSGLSQADRNLATTLVLGVLRWQIALDARLRPLLQRPDLEMAPAVAIVLRLGAFQLLHLDRIPAHAALSESVELVREAGHGHAAGMVNAILRKLTRQETPKPKLYETIPALSERLAHPAWLVERWARSYGRAAALAICEYDQQPPPLGTLFTDVEDDLRMDDGSRLVAELASAAMPLAKRIWDCCAAPGGKTLVLARRHPLAEVVASDVNSKRVRALSERLRTAGAANVRVIEADALKLPDDEGAFDLILCDVPCTGTGTLGRNPEIKHRLEPAEFSRQARRQREILAAALSRLAPGGRLVYSTCSLEPEENERVVEEVLSHLPVGSGIEVLTIEPVLENLVANGRLSGDAAHATSGLVRDGSLRTLPGVGFQGDGFFAAVLTKQTAKPASGV